MKVECVPKTLIQFQFEYEELVEIVASIKQFLSKDKEFAIIDPKHSTLAKFATEADRLI